MKKALAILMAIAMVSMTFAQGMPAPTLTYGFSGSVETQLLKEKTEAQNVGTGTYQSNTSEMRPTALTPTRLKYETFANMDWAKMTINAKVKYDSHKSNFKDFSTFDLTTTWKDFFGFKVVHTYKGSNTEAGLKKPSETKDISSKKVESKLSFTLDKLKSDGFKFYVDYDAVRFLSHLNVAQSGDAVSNLLAGFYKMGFEIDNDEVAAKIAVKNTYNGGTTAGGATTSDDKIELADAKNDIEVDALQIEAKKMFGVWSAIFNSKDAMSYRLKNLGSAGKIDQLKYELGKENTILGEDNATGAMNINNTITPIKGVTIKVGVVAPVFYTQSVQDWLRGGETALAFTTTGLLTDRQDTDDNKYKEYNASNLAFALQYSTDTLGTISAGMRVNQDYTIVKLVGTDVIEGSTRALMAHNSTDSKKILWGNAAWVEADLSKMLGKDKGLFAWVDGQSGEYLHNYDNGLTIPADAKYKLKTGTATKMNIGAEFKMKASDALSVEFGAQGSLGFGYDYKKANANVSYNEVAITGVNALKAVNSNLVDASYNEANYLAKTVYGITPLTIKARVDFKLNPTVTLYVKDEFKTLDKQYDNSVKDGAVVGEFGAGGKTAYGYNDKNTLTLGAKLTATKKSTLTAEGSYSAWTNVPAFSKLAPVNGYTDDNAKKKAQSNYDAYLSKTYTPWSIKATYAYKY